MSDPHEYGDAHRLQAQRELERLQARLRGLDRDLQPQEYEQAWEAFWRHEGAMQGKTPERVEAELQLDRLTERAAQLDPQLQPEEYDRAWEQVGEQDAFLQGKTVEQLRAEDYAAEMADFVDHHRDEYVWAVSSAVTARDTAYEQGDPVGAAVFGGEAREALADAARAGITPEDLAAELDYPGGAEELLSIDAEFVRSQPPSWFEQPEDLAGISIPDPDCALAAAQERAERAVAQARERLDGIPEHSPAVIESRASAGVEQQSTSAAAEEAERERRDTMDREAEQAAPTAEYVREQADDPEIDRGTTF